jgi:hypothetical protein
MLLVFLCGIKQSKKTTQTDASVSQICNLHTGNMNKANFTKLKKKALSIKKVTIDVPNPIAYIDYVRLSQ